MPWGVFCGGFEARRIPEKGCTVVGSEGPEMDYLAPGEKPACTGSSGWLHRLARLVLTPKRMLEMFVISSWRAKARANRKSKKKLVKKKL
ncbi:hypothetical protein CDL15_Pgr012417 [Punica granatum]|uniref:Uncharacterized protein n=1 Tax=Punica granatum TaxID=22663 RepID=A0A218WXW5_PUNGR|nr:hypothetical protein CDL15_Pgr012417 [Punica granatum]